MSRSFQVTFDAASPRDLADFWIEALDYERQPPPPGYATWEEFGLDNEISADQFDALVDPDGAGPRLFFQKVPEGKTAKNRVHLDVIVTDRGETREQNWKLIEAEADRLQALGAERIGTFEASDIGMWIVMQDPEGNEFCIE